VRDIVKLYPYDVAPDIDTTGDGIADDGSLRGSTTVVAERIRKLIQEKVEIAGLEIVEARITYLAYAPEIASAMLQRQQANAIIDARLAKSANCPSGKNPANKEIVIPSPHVTILGTLFLLSLVKFSGNNPSRAIV